MRKMFYYHCTSRVKYIQKLNEKFVGEVVKVIKLKMLTKKLKIFKSLINVVESFYLELIGFLYKTSFMMLNHTINEQVYIYFI